MEQHTLQTIATMELHLDTTVPGRVPVYQVPT